jgi:hypothetical protein
MKIKRIVPYALAAALALSIIGCSFKRYEKREVSDYRVSLNGKTGIELANANGDIKVYKGDSASGIVIRAEKIAKVKKRDLNKPFTEARVEIDSTSEIIKINTEFESSNGIFRFDFGRDVEINFNISIPPGVKLSIDNTNGDLRITDISNDVQVSIVNGGVDVDNTSGLNKFDITNGKIKGSLDSTKGLIIDITNGGVDLKLDSTFSANFNIETVNGKITQENLNFETLTAENKYLRGKIGSSSAEVKIDVVNGKVKLSRK